VIVADSGRQSFKTFNVGTAACILAAAAGAHVINGVSRSVPSMSGSVDVLSVLDIPTTSTPTMVAARLERNRIVFLDHCTFCPTYTDSYDRIFSTLSPFSFFLPVAVLAVRASSFVYGIADTNVSMATRAIRAARPDLTRGVVVAGEIGPREVLATHAGYGLDHTAILEDDNVTVHRRPRHAPSSRWRPAVAHQPNHEGNAAMVVDCLAPDSDGARIHLVERQAALILAAAYWREIDQDTALTHVRNVRITGGAIRLLKQLQADNEVRR
jgi:anthranilate phosphoribosyltransferase